MEVGSIALGISCGMERGLRKEIRNAADGLENINLVSEGIMSDYLKSSKCVPILNKVAICSQCPKSSNSTYRLPRRAKLSWVLPTRVSTSEYWGLSRLAWLGNECLPVKEKQSLTLAVIDLAGSIKAAFPGIDCETGDTSEVCADLLRGVRLHSAKLLKGLEEGDSERAQLGLGHAYSRGKVKVSACVLPISFLALLQGQHALHCHFFRHTNAPLEILL